MARAIAGQDAGRSLPSRGRGSGSSPTWSAPGATSPSSACNGRWRRPPAELVWHPFLLNPHLPRRGRDPGAVSRAQVRQRGAGQGGSIGERPRPGRAKGSRSRSRPSGRSRTRSRPRAGPGGGGPAGGQSGGRACSAAFFEGEIGHRRPGDPARDRREAGLAEQGRERRPRPGRARRGPRAHEQATAPRHQRGAGLRVRRGPRHRRSAAARGAGGPPWISSVAARQAPGPSPTSGPPRLVVAGGRRALPPRARGPAARRPAASRSRFGRCSFSQRFMTSGSSLGASSRER